MKLRLKPLSIFLAVILLGCQSESKSKPLFQFAFLTDIHVQPERDAVEGFRKAIDHTNRLKPEFVITGGDLIMDALSQSKGRSDSLYQIYAELSQGFDMPVYNTMGNHEVFGLYKDSGIAPDHPEYGKQMYLNHMGMEQPYYSFDHKGWHFVILDAIGFTEDRRYIGEIDSIQLEWLREDLKTLDKETPLVLSTHIPLVSVVPQLVGGGQANAGAGYLVTNTDELMKIVKPYNLKLVLQGHLHHVEDVYFNATHFVTGGAVCARWWLGPQEGMEEGFMMFEVFPDSISWSYIDYGWEVIQEQIDV
ncbi:MAG: metallophosphoesterase [Candidatus Marinimicrobia bacterium]|nr:metallophosphoesterase [Candidatus Neomarinimicrobiota bacterium]